MTNLEEMDRFPKTYTLQRMNHKQIENLNSPMTINEIQSIKKQTKEKLPMNKVWDEVTSLINHTKKNLKS